MTTNAITLTGSLFGYKELEVSIETASSVNKNAVTKDIVVSLTAPAPGGGVTVDYTTVDNTAQSVIYGLGKDFEAASGTVSFAGGEQTKNITITINNNPVVNLDRTFNVVISNPVNAILGSDTHTCTIVDGSTVFDVTDYGATGNGATDDTDAIQDAIDAANSVGGGVVYFPAGTYIIGKGGDGFAGTQITTYENITWAGENKTSTIIKRCDFCLNGMINIKNATYSSSNDSLPFSFYRLTFDSNAFQQKYRYDGENFELWKGHDWSQEQSSILRLSGSGTYAGRLTWKMQDIFMKDSCSDGISITYNTDFRGYDIQTQNHFRGAIVINGGNCIIDVVGLTSNYNAYNPFGNEEELIHLEPLSRGYTGEALDRNGDPHYGGWWSDILLKDCTGKWMSFGGRSKGGYCYNMASISSASQAVVTWTNHYLDTGDQIFFTNMSGDWSLLDGDENTNQYIVEKITNNSFYLKQNGNYVDTSTFAVFSPTNYVEFCGECNSGGILTLDNIVARSGVYFAMNGWKMTVGNGCKLPVKRWGTTSIPDGDIYSTITMQQPGWVNSELSSNGTTWFADGREVRYQGWSLVDGRTYTYKWNNTPSIAPLALYERIEGGEEIELTKITSGLIGDVESTTGSWALISNVIYYHPSDNATNLTDLVWSGGGVNVYVVTGYRIRSYSLPTHSLPYITLTNPVTVTFNKDIFTDRDDVYPAEPMESGITYGAKMGTISSADLNFLGCTFADNVNSHVFYITNQQDLTGIHIGKAVDETFTEINSGGYIIYYTGVVSASRAFDWTFSGVNVNNGTGMSYTYMKDDVTNAITAADVYLSQEQNIIATYSTNTLTNLTYTGKRTITGTVSPMDINVSHNHAHGFEGDEYHNTTDDSWWDCTARGYLKGATEVAATWIKR